MKNFTFLRNFLPLFLLMLLAFGASAQCNYTLEMNDSYGDGWNGNTMDVSVNGTVVLSGVTLASGSQGTLTFSVNTGDDVTTTWIGGGSWGSETSYQILDAVGGVAGGAAQADITTGTITASCPACTPAAFNTATVVNGDCALGTFDIEVDITALGDGTPVLNYGTGTLSPLVVGINTIAGLTVGTTYTLTLEHGVDPVCDVAVGSYAYTAPCNDDFANAYTIACGGSDSGDTGAATLDDPSLPSGGNCGGGGLAGPNVWYTFVGDGQDFTASLCASGYDTRVDVFCDDAGTLYCVGGNDDNCPGFRSEYTFGTAAGKTYYIMVHGYNGATGAYQLDLSCAAACGTPPANDDCAGGTGCRAFGTAEVLTVATTCTVVTGDNTCAATAPSNPSCDGFGEIKDIWYSFVAPATGVVNVDVALGSATEMEAAVYDACGGVETACGDIDTGGENIDLTGLTGGATYYIQVWSNTAEAGTFDICVTEVPINNDCIDAIDISDEAPDTFDTAGANDSGVVGCATNPDDDIWYVATTTVGDNLLTINCTGADWEVFDGNSGCGGASLGCNIASYVIPAPASANVFYIRVYDPAVGFTGGANERSAGGTISISHILPAELTSFTGNAMDKYNTLKWETASEQNTSEFAIERSLDGRNNWEVIGTERAAGNSDASIAYSFDDMRPITQAYYRLNTIDLDGSAQTSNIVSIKRAAAGFDVVLVAPNPTNTKTTVTFESAKDANVNAVVTDITGKVISTLTQDAIRGLNNMTIDLSNAPSGVYFLTMNNGVNNITRRIVKN